MADLSAQDAAVWLETEGALLEGLVSKTTAADWQAVINLIRSVGWWAHSQMTVTAPRFTLMPPSERSGR